MVASILPRFTAAVALPEPVPERSALLKRWYCDLQVGWRIRRAGPPSVVLVAGWGGMGDDLLYTALAREFRERTGRPVWVLSRHPRLFLGHPAVAAVLPPRPHVIAALRRSRAQLLSPGYTRNADNARRHVLALMAAEAGLPGAIRLAPELYLRPHERSRGRIAGRQIVFQSSALSARYPSPNKQWPVERMAEVVRRLPAGLTAVQIGGSHDPLLPGAVDRRGLPDVRETAAIVASSEALVGLEGFVAHLARAVGVRSVVVYGGYTSPGETGYPCNENLFTPVECAPCWQPVHCDFGRRCLEAITPAQVLAALERTIARRPLPLETAVADATTGAVTLLP